MEKYFQIGYLLTISDKFNRSNIIHWHGFCALRHLFSTNASEHFALDKVLRTLRNLQEIVS